MPNRKIAANYIIGPNFFPIKNGVVEVKEDGTIISITTNDSEKAGTEYYPGIIVPGFVNAHCHLELSHLKNTIPKHTGMIGFLEAINARPPFEQETIIRALKNADRQMWETGTVACGDISNGSDSLPVKLKSNINYHTFVEVFGFMPQRAKAAFSRAKDVLNQFKSKNLPVSVVPHAPYSMSDQLFELVVKNAEENRSILSFHHLESKHENDLIKHASGDFINYFKTFLKFNIDKIVAKKSNASEYFVSQIASETPLLLIHNLSITQKDIDWIKTNRESHNTYFVLCPNSNLYIHNRLPDFQLFRENELNICLGTDSLASNYSLSMLEEMKTIQNHHKNLAFPVSLKWATLNGAKALSIEKDYGSIEIGKKPGLNVIFPLNFKEMKLTNDSFVKKIV